jgi:hypothetical protein
MEMAEIIDFKSRLSKTNTTTIQEPKLDYEVEVITDKRILMKYCHP